MKGLLPVVALACLLLAPMARADSRNRLYRTSRWLLGAMTVADAASSWNQQEANPLLRGRCGRFRVRGAAIKGGVTTAILLSQRPHRPITATATNVSISGLYAGMTVYNIRVRGR